MVTSTAQSDRLLAWMSSLADATRLRLLRLLERHELGVVDLCDVLQLPQSTVSRHLKVLGNHHWVRSRREGTTHLYRTILDELEPAARKLWLLAREQTDGSSAVRQDKLRLERRLRERKIDSQTFFAGAAAQWDHLRRELYGERFSTAAMLCLLSSDLVIADLGCGSGNLVADLAASVKHVIGIDNSPAMLKAAKQRTAGLPNVEIRRGDLAKLPIESASCDAALMVLVLTYLPDPKAAVNEMARILMPNGRGVIVDLLPHDRDDFRRQLGQTSLGLEPTKLAQLMNDAGLADVKIDSLPPESNAKGPALFLARAIRTEIET
jgi:ubiquinone/menaquinone biosynthesis C-methylase UbiE/DNA-binding transcriptional ArsR family regulator